MDDAHKLLNRLVREGILQANGVFQFFPANSIGDDIVLYTDESRQKELGRLPMLRQQWERQGQKSFHSLADFVAPADSKIADYLGMFAVTTGTGIDPIVAEFEANHDDYSAIMVKALADRLAEAFAEYLHKQARTAWGFGKSETLTNDDLIEEKYQGIRPAPGYPACPDHLTKRAIWSMLDVKASTGIVLTESLAMHPAASVSGLYFSHPQARYFAVDMLTRDQVENYAKRMTLPLREVERWLAPNLSYDPDA